jgi:transposase
MKAYSVDLRERVADAVLQDGLTWAAVARLFRLSVASVGRFVHAVLPPAQRARKFRFFRCSWGGT